MTVKTLIEESFLKPEECDFLIKRYKEHTSLPIENQKIKPWDTVLPLEIFGKENTCPQFLFNKVSESAFKVNGSVLDWLQIVKWPSPNPGKNLHWDIQEKFGYSKPLTEKQKKFAQIYCSSKGLLSNQECATEAGYSKESAYARAHELLNPKICPDVVKYIKEIEEETTSLACIIYLNDNFSGGETYFEDGTKFSPVKGRALFFDGNYYKHGVKSVDHGDRYVVAGWFNQGESPPQKISYIE